MCVFNEDFLLVNKSILMGIIKMNLDLPGSKETHYLLLLSKEVSLCGGFLWNAREIHKEIG